MCGLDKPTLPTHDPNRVEPYKASTSSTHSGSDEKRRLSCDPPVSDRRLTRCDPFRVKLPVMHEKAPKRPYFWRITMKKKSRHGAEKITSRWKFFFFVERAPFASRCNFFSSVMVFWRHRRRFKIRLRAGRTTGSARGHPSRCTQRLYP